VAAMTIPRSKMLRVTVVPAGVDMTASEAVFLDWDILNQTC